MNEDFVPFELAKKLKEKGFRYNKNNLLDRLCMENQINYPPISQVLKWLRKEKKIYIISQPFASMATTDKVVWSWHWKHNSDGEFIDITYSDDTSYISYEEASVAGINYVLDNVI